jgi:hypothetical protein
VKPFYSGRIVSKLMAKNTSLLTKNTAQFHFDTRKWQKRQSGRQFTILIAKKYFIWPKITGFRRKNIEETT